MRTFELSGAALDWAVQQCEGKRKDIDFVWWTDDHYSPSTDWSQGGPIIEREKISLWTEGYVYEAKIYGNHEQWGTTPLIAAMRCYVASKLGDTVDIPDNLIGE